MQNKLDQDGADKIAKSIDRFTTAVSFLGTLYLIGMALGAIMNQINFVT